MRILKSITDRLYKRNQNYLAVLVGGTGTGKSYAGLKFCEKIDPSFNISRVVFSPEEFMALLNAGTLKKGNAILFDEIGVGMDARSFMQFSNKAMSYILQTFRWENLAVIFTVPSLAFLDTNARRLVHAVIETVEIDYKNNLCMVKYLRSQNNPRATSTKKEVYHKYPKYRMAKGGFQTVTKMRVGLPSQKLLDTYEEKKQAFGVKLREDLEKDFKYKQQKLTQKQEKLSPQQIADRIRSNPKKYKNVTIANISAEFNVGDTVARRVRTMV